MKKRSWPQKLIVSRVNDEDEDDVFACAETPEEISEDFADEPVAVYQLVAVGRFRVEKSVDGKFCKVGDHAVDAVALDGMSHDELVALVGKLGLKLHTRNLSTKRLRRHLREYLTRKR